MTTLDFDSEYEAAAAEARAALEAALEKLNNHQPSRNGLGMVNYGHVVEVRNLATAVSQAAAQLTDRA